MLAAGPVGIRLAKACINKSLSLDIDSGLDFEAEAFGSASARRTRRKGMTAFLEKRTPTYSGK